MQPPLEIPADYHCPFCPDHKDYDFVWSDLAGTHICLGCRDEISCGLDFDNQPDMWEYSGADTIERLLKFRGIDYAMLQQLNEQKESSSDHDAHTIIWI